VIWSALALDQSMTATGWAHMGQGDKAPTWGVKSLPHWGDNEGKHLWDWFEWLGAKCTDLAVTHLYFEAPIDIQDHREPLTEKIAQYGLPAMACVVQHLLTKRGQPIVLETIGVRTWRADVLGSPEPPKGLVKHQRRAWLKDKAVQACIERGWAVTSDNAADALCILMCACAMLDPKFASSQGPLFRRAEARVDNERRALK
jgi:hypothetical protein